MLVFIYDVYKLLMRFFTVWEAKQVLGRSDQQNGEKNLFAVVREKKLMMAKVKIIENMFAVGENYVIDVVKTIKQKKGVR